MTVDNIVQLVSGVGFPVAMCVALFWYNIKQEDRHREEIKSLDDTIANNTKVLTELTTLIKTLIK